MWDRIKSWFYKPEPIEYRWAYINVGAYNVEFKFRNGKSIYKSYLGSAYWTEEYGLSVYVVDPYKVRELVAQEGVRFLYLTRTYSDGVIWDDVNEVGYPRETLETVDLGDRHMHLERVRVPVDFHDPRLIESP